MAKRLLILDPQSLIRLLTHYTDGEVPLDTEVRSIGQSPYLQRLFMFDCVAGDWPNAQLAPNNLGYYPLHFRYIGRKTLSWGGPKDEYQWKQSLESPKNQS